ncbi:unnamed protein product [Dibothriocephalus latus]|uniref:Uncharacterized protein n=1 Tax=Dibothriocephalus latus TaxID=60516 RepID=A0A3P7NV12_DIBLA|nr:unnamed protein product [Dibothriocephalus latus]
MALTAEFLRFVLLGFCVAYCVIGICFAGIGLYDIVLMQSLPDVSFTVIWVPTLLLVLGISLGFVAVFGSVGAGRRNKCLLITFATESILMLLAPLAFAIFALIMGGRIFALTLEVFKKDQSAATAWWGPIEMAFNCCGVNGPDDYTTISIPGTCCEPETIVCASENAYKRVSKKL